ncbi:MAG TPA: GlcNAc-PI de-N-acetylase [Chloroflexi bacterium]|nr:GlcNAc-PI de-N-acetylase [Chloroflexota bacterium]HHW88475.1 GlcNAc-PI de-N-acetylase [Chloroflexota bacterium]
MRKRVLLGVFAHPDDESFGPGGTLAHYAQRGVDVHVIIATDGIAGSVDSEGRLRDHDSLAQVRSAELAQAAVHLRLKSIWSLPYRDSGMRGAPDNHHPAALIQQPVTVVAHAVLAYIQRLAPDVVMTHDPFGGYGHPDHIRVCEATTTAFYLARARRATVNGVSHAPQKLYYSAFPKQVIKMAVPLMRLAGKDPTAIGRNQDINLVEISRWVTPVTTTVDVADALADKQRASEAHASQYSGGPGWLSVLPAPIRRRVAGREQFTCVFPGNIERGEHDLFAGVA